MQQEEQEKKVSGSSSRRPKSEGNRKKERRSRSVEVPRQKSTGGKHAQDGSNTEEKKRRSKSHRTRKGRDAMNDSSRRTTRHPESSEEFTTDNSGGGLGQSMRDTSSKRSNRASRRSKEVDRMNQSAPGMNQSERRRPRNGRYGGLLDNSNGSGDGKRSSHVSPRPSSSADGLTQSAHGDTKGQRSRSSRPIKPMDDSSRARRHDRRGRRASASAADSAARDEMNQSSRREVHKRHKQSSRRRVEGDMPKKDRKSKTPRKVDSEPLPDLAVTKEQKSAVAKEQKRRAKRQTSPAPDAINQAMGGSMRVSPERESKHSSQSGHASLSKIAKPQSTEAGNLNKIRARRASAQHSRSPKRGTTIVPRDDAPEMSMSQLNVRASMNDSMQDSRMVAEMIADSMKGQEQTLLMQKVNLRDFPMGKPSNADVPKGVDTNTGKKVMIDDRITFCEGDMEREWYSKEEIGAMAVTICFDEAGPDGCWRGLEHIQLNVDKEKHIKEHVQSVKIKQITLNRRQKKDNSFDAAEELRTFSRLDSKEDRKKAKIVAREDASFVKREERIEQKKLAAEEEQTKRTDLMSKLNPVAVMSATVERCSHAVVDVTENTTKMVSDTIFGATTAASTSATNAATLVSGAFAGATTAVFGGTAASTGVSKRVTAGFFGGGNKAVLATNKPKMFGPAPCPSPGRTGKPAKYGQVNLVR